MNKTKNAFKGVTLVELLVSLSLLAVLFCCSLPFMPSLYKKNQLQMVSNEIKGAIDFAKMQSLLTGDALVLTHLPGAKGWSEGMLLFVDNPKHQYNSDAKVLHEWRWKSEGIQVAWRGFQSADYLLFSPDISSSTVNGSFLITDSMQKQIKLVVNRLGRVKVVFARHEAIQSS